MKHLLIAENLKHAQALLWWCRLDYNLWDIILYGAPVPEVYQNCILARPLTEVTEEQCEWVVTELQPKVFGSIRTLAPNWTLETSETEELDAA